MGGENYYTMGRRQSIYVLQGILGATFTPLITMFNNLLTSIYTSYLFVLFLGDFEAYLGCLVVSVEAYFWCLLVSLEADFWDSKTENL